MKTKSSVLLFGSILAAALFTRLSIPDQQSSPKSQTKPAVTKSLRSVQVNPPAPILEEATEDKLPQDSMLELPSDDEESAHLTDWKQRFEHLKSETGDLQQAVDRLRAEIDASMTGWVTDEIQPIAKLPPAERYDRLDLISQSVSEGAAAIFESLGLPGGRHVATAAEALDIVAAEIQYAETAPDPSSRLALLHLDRERQVKLDQVVAVTDEDERAVAEAQLEAWYSEGLAKVFPADSITFENP